MNLFQEVKRAVPASAAAKMYGLKVNRGGMARCPFHHDRTPSMKVDERYFCFACHATGDAIDLTAQLLGLSMKDAALRLVDDFGIDVDKTERYAGHGGKMRGHPAALPANRIPDWDITKMREAELSRAVNTLLEYLWMLKAEEEIFAPDEDSGYFSPLYKDATYQELHVECLIDELTEGTLEDRWEFYSRYEKEIKRYEC